MTDTITPIRCQACESAFTRPRRNDDGLFLACRCRPERWVADVPPAPVTTEPHQYETVSKCPNRNCVGGMVLGEAEARTCRLCGGKGFRIEYQLPRGTQG